MITESTYLTPMDQPISGGHTKLPIKPIDKLAANLVRIQTEKLEKPTSKLDKIAENLAKSHANMVPNGDEQQRSHRGIDLSTSPRGWESAASSAKPVDFSGMDLSSRKVSKPPAELPSPYAYPEYHQQQHREMDLSTKKSTSKLHPSIVRNSPLFLYFYYFCCFSHLVEFFFLLKYFSNFIFDLTNSKSRVNIFSYMNFKVSHT